MTTDILTLEKGGNNMTGKHEFPNTAEDCLTNHVLKYTTKQRSQTDQKTTRITSTRTREPNQVMTHHIPKPGFTTETADYTRIQTIKL